MLCCAQKRSKIRYRNGSSCQMSPRADSSRVKSQQLHSGALTTDASSGVSVRRARKNWRDICRKVGEKISITEKRQWLNTVLNDQFISLQLFRALRSGSDPAQLLMPHNLTITSAGAGTGACQVIEYRFEPEGETEFCEESQNHIVRRSKIKSCRS